jgi:hypothetical protein
LVSNKTRRVAFFNLNQKSTSNLRITLSVYIYSAFNQFTIWQQRCDIEKEFGGPATPELDLNLREVIKTVATTNIGESYQRVLDILNCDM